jgi:putative peptidoglycan lipid II flippase
VSTPVAERGSARPRGGGIGRAAVLIGAITMLARVIGFGRQVVFAHTVQASCLGTAYTTANMVPNIIYDIVAGGALTAVVVPVLAGPVRSDPEQVRRTSAALLSWAVLLLVPVSLIIAAIARPLVSVLLGGTPGCPRADMVTLSARMLVVFAPQILLYGLAVVLYGILQAHRRFAAPALAPVLSSLVVIGAYFWFGVVGGGYQDLARPVPTLAWIVLAVGTTAGVAALVATPLIPAVRLHLRLRPSLRFPPGIGARVRTLAAAGVATLIAQDASVAVVIVLANSRGGGGALVLYSFAWAVFFVPYAVLAVPIATSAFPELSARAVSPSTGSFDATSATSTRAVTVASWLGVAGMAGTCVPLARVFQSHASQAADARQLAIALAAFAPGLVGYGLMANLSRVLYAEGSKGRSRAAALAVSGGWLLVIVADLVIVPLVPRSVVVPWLGVGTTLGLTGSGVALLFLVRRFRGRDALAGCARATLAGLAGAAAGTAAGLGVAAGLRVTGFLPNVGVTLLASAAVLVAFLAVVAVADGGDLRAVTRKVIRL